MMRLAFRGLSPRMLGASGRRLRGGPTPFTGILPHLSGVPGPPRRDDLRISFKEHPVIRSFKDQNTRLFFEGGRVRAFRKFADQAVRRLTLLDRTDALDDLAVLPGNRLEALPGDRAGQHSIRINAARRICFRWASDGPHDVEIVDDRSVGEGRRP